MVKDYPAAAIKEDIKVVSAYVSDRACGRITESAQPTSALLIAHPMEDIASVLRSVDIRGPRGPAAAAPLPLAVTDADEVLHEDAEDDYGDAMDLDDD